MQQAKSDSPRAKPVRIPLLIIRMIDDRQIAVRFWNIGGRQQFMLLLQRFCSEFLLARGEKIDGLDWRVVTRAQRPEIEDFARRYGLQVSEEE